MLLNQTIKQRWVEALRSGMYQQGTGALKQETPAGVKYCCLGVLCELKEVSWVPWTYNPSKKKAAYATQFSDAAFVPYALAKEIGLQESTQVELVEKNDSLGESFEQIANWVEANL